MNEYEIREQQDGLKGGLEEILAICPALYKHRRQEKEMSEEKGD